MSVQKMKDLVGNAKAGLFALEDAMPHGDDLRRRIYALRVELGRLGALVVEREERQGVTRLPPRSPR
jgi:hypothetical protein